MVNKRLVEIINLDDIRNKKSPKNSYLTELNKISTPNDTVPKIFQIPANQKFYTNRSLSNSNSITDYLSCTRCQNLKPKEMTFKEWFSIEFGTTPWGIQIWCTRCDVNIFHMDLEGTNHPINIDRHKK